MNEIHKEIKSARLRQDEEWGGSAHDDVHEPEKWCAVSSSSAQAR